MDHYSDYRKYHAYWAIDCLYLTAKKIKTSTIITE